MNIIPGTKVYFACLNKQMVTEHEVVEVRNRTTKNGTSTEYLILDVYEHQYDKEDGEYGYLQLSLDETISPIALRVSWNSTAVYYFKKAVAQNIVRKEQIRKHEETIKYIKEHTIPEAEEALSKAEINLKYVTTIHSTDDKDFVGQMKPNGGGLQYKIVEDNEDTLILDCLDCRHGFTCRLEVIRIDETDEFQFSKMIGDDSYWFHHNGTDIVYVRGKWNYFNEAYSRVIKYWREYRLEKQQKVADLEQQIAELKRKKS